MHDYRTEQIILAEGTVRTRRLKPPRPAVPSRAAGDKRSFVLLVAAVLLLSLIWVWSNLPVQGQLDHAAPGEMDTASSFEYGLSLLAFLIGWSAVAASIVIPAWLVRPYSNGERRSIRFVASCFLAWLTLGAVTLAGDVLLHAAVHAQAWLAANDWTLAVGPLTAAAAYEFTGLKQTMLLAWSGTHAAPGLSVDRRRLRVFAKSGYGGLGAFAPLLLVVFALGDSSLAWALALGAVIAAQSCFPAAWARPCVRRVISAYRGRRSRVVRRRSRLRPRWRGVWLMVAAHQQSKSPRVKE